MFTLKQFVSSNFCLRCNGCCRFSQQDTIWSPRLLDEEIKEFLKENLPPAIINSDKKIRLMPCLEQDNFICSLFNPKDNKCTIYPLRPFECQLYPFVLNRRIDKIFLAVDLKCPFARRDLENQEFNSYTRYLINFFRDPNAVKILQGNSQIIQAYEEIVNLAQLEL